MEYDISEHLDQLLSAVSPVILHYFDDPNNGKIEEVAVSTDPDDRHRVGISVVWLMKNARIDLSAVPFEGQMFLKNSGWRFKSGYQTTRAVATQVLDFNDDLEDNLKLLKLIPGPIVKQAIQQLVCKCYYNAREYQRSADTFSTEWRRDTEEMPEVIEFFKSGVFDKNWRSGSYLDTAGGQRVLNDLSYCSWVYFANKEILPALCRYYELAGLSEF